MLICLTGSANIEPRGAKRPQARARPTETMPPPTAPPYPAPRSDSAVEVLQFTDLHLYGDPADGLLGVTTWQSFEKCLELARRHHWPPDLLLATGDLVHDGSTAGYRRLRQRLRDCAVPVYALPGNHDNPQRLRDELHDANTSADSSVICGGWQIILLDSTVPDSDHGELPQTQLELLEHCLAAHPDHHTLVCLHHPPVSVGSTWIDQLRLANPEALFAVLDRHPQVRGVLWGHIHQDFTAERKGVRLIGSPSTCIQFRPNSREFALDDRPPGYRHLRLERDGGIVTDVVRLDHVPSGLDLQSHGY
jgi:Icc protein